MKNNTWAQKLRRTITSVLPIDEERSGNCTRCGECCKLPVRCPFLDFDSEGFAMCKIYNMRPLNCRKYPRNEDEHIVPNCGYSFIPEEEHEVAIK